MLISLLAALYIFLRSSSGFAEVNHPILSLEPSNISTLYVKIQGMSLQDLELLLHDDDHDHPTIET